MGDQLKQKAKSLTENSKNLDEAKKAVSALTSSRYRQSTHQRGRRAAPTDCAGMITIATLVITIVSENPASPQVRILIHSAVDIWETMMTKILRCHHPMTKLITM